MKNDFRKKLSFEHKCITKFIFQGLTIAQIAKKMNYSQSTVANRMNSLFRQYSSKTRMEFVMSVLGEIIQNNKTNLEAQEERLKCLEKEIAQSKEILSGLIKNLDNKENKEYWFKMAADFLAK
ncbi:MAG: hypothetical protein IJ003_00845 [Candidatus Gastranaerophilales bacterium]|nr:hypothetical protein [Candidatus Gastranaerophilales bacterium]